MLAEVSPSILTLSLILQKACLRRFWVIILSCFLDVLHEAFKNVVQPWVFFRHRQAFEFIIIPEKSPEKAGSSPKSCLGFFGIHFAWGVSTAAG